MADMPVPIPSWVNVICSLQQCEPIPFGEGGSRSPRWQIKDVVLKEKAPGKRETFA